MTNHCVFRGYGTRILPVHRDEFLKVRETLTRVGIKSQNTAHTVIQEVFLLHKRGSYGLLHYTELEALDGKESSPTAEQIGIRNTVSYLLDQWGLVELEDPRSVSQPRCTDGSLIVVPYKEKSKYHLIAAYQIGKVKP